MADAFLTPTRRVQQLAQIDPDPGALHGAVEVVQNLDPEANPLMSRLGHIERLR